jgi:branched-chain amino acid transport system permease protein
LALKIVVDGLFLGSVILLIALGFSLLIGMARIFHLAHVEFYMIGGLLVWYFSVRLGVNYWLSIPIALVIATPLAIAVEKYLLRRFRSDVIATVVISLALIFMIEAAVLVIFGAATQMTVPAAIPGFVDIWGLHYTLNRLVTLIVCVVAASAGIWFVHRTQWGRAMRAIHENQAAAILQGVSLDRTCMLTVALATILAVISGALVVPMFAVNAYTGTSILLISLVAIIIGGIGSIGGVVIACFGIGLIQSGVSAFASAQLSSLVLFCLMVLVMIIRPQGLFGHELVVD